jgi:hypothetical protein
MSIHAMLFNDTKAKSETFELSVEEAKWREFPQNMPFELIVVAVWTTFR